MVYALQNFRMSRSGSNEHFDFQTKQEEQSVKNKKHQKLDKALDVIRKKYGEDAVKKGTLLK